MVENVEEIKNTNIESVKCIKQILFEMQVDILKETDSTPEDLISALISTLVDLVGAYEEVTSYSVTQETLGHLRYKLEKMDELKRKHKIDIDKMKRDAGF